MKDLLAALEQQLKQLTQQAKAIDGKQSSWQQKAWFDSDLFQSHSPFLTDYVLEAEAMLKRLKASTEQRTSSAQALAAKLSAQIQALSRAFQTKDLRYLPGKVKKRAVSPNASEQAQAMVGQLRRSTQELYQQLSEYQGFERRLLDMLELEQRQLWDKSVAEYSAKLKAAGVEFINIDNKPFYDATAAVRAKYGAPYADIIARIDAVQ